MFDDRPYRRQRPPGTTPNASKFWFPELVDSRKSLAEVYAQAVRRLCAAYVAAVSIGATAMAMNKAYGYE